jgi:UDP-glucose:(heptosyl)LPS alpha-1,3-glucosyltransferase
VALVIERFQPRGGVERAAWTVAHGLAAGGDEVHVFAREVAEEAARGPEPRPRAHRLRVAARWQPWRVLAFSRAARQAAPRGRFDVVHSFSRTRHQDLFRAGGGCHAAYMERAYGRAGARARRLSPRHAVLLGVERRVFGDASQTLQCNSEMVRDEIASRYAVPPERFAVIPNGVDVERFHPRRRREEGRRLRAALAPDAARVWLLAGHGFRRKGLDTALAALARRDVKDEVLWVAGADAPEPWRARAARLGLVDRVRFLGPRDDLPALYAAADALVLPTRYDAFANVCLEAAAAGLPIVTSGANGAARWLGAAALVVEDPEDADGLAAALDALGDPGHRAALGVSARARAETASWDAHLRALRALYARIAR